MRILLLSAIVLVSACGGQVQAQSSAVDAGAGGSAGSTHTGGSAGSGGSSSKGGSGGSAGASWAACAKPGTCVLEPKTGCCSACTPTADQLAAVQYQHTDAYMKSICASWPVSCEPCLEPANPNLAAFCESGACIVVDIPLHAVSACTASADCILQVAGCCPTCKPSSDQIVAVNKGQVAAYQGQMCNPDYDYGCPGCIPEFPPWVAAACVNGHCMVVSAQE
ncbi:MAG: hypothetical protein HY898_18935 [Deltaproteobacteria bacterium]|nr:hypothetical protein [Deltaproteobacteria bacterium]